jgi:Holliday junction resolvase RusA-like endonuclease
MEYLLTIPGRLDGLNKFIGANRSNSCAGNNMKKRNERAVSKAIENCLHGVKIENPVYMEYIWYERDMRRDLDNISSFGRKVIQDALVNAAVLKGDGWKYVVGFSDRFEIDKTDPRIEVKIKEI